MIEGYVAAAQEASSGLCAMAVERVVNGLIVAGPLIPLVVGFVVALMDEYTPDKDAPSNAKQLGAQQPRTRTRPIKGVMQAANALPTRLGAVFGICVLVFYLATLTHESPTCATPEWSPLGISPSTVRFILVVIGFLGLIEAGEAMLRKKELYSALALATSATVFGLLGAHNLTSVSFFGVGVSDIPTMTIALSFTYAPLVIYSLFAYVIRVRNK